MIFVVLYAIAVWTIAWRFRRRWPAFAAVLLAAPPIVLSAHFDVWLVRTVFDEDASWLVTLASLFAGIIVFIALLLSFQPRSKPSHVCVVCEYDMRGLSARTCPECGAELTEDTPKPQRARPILPVAPEGSLAIQLADNRRDRKRESSKLSAVTKAAPPATDTPITTQ